MMKMIGLLGILGFVKCQRPDPCYAPEQFVAKAFVTDTERSVSHEKVVTITYDAVNMRKHYAEKIKQTDGTYTDYAIIQFYKEGYEYEIDYFGEECKKEHLRSTFSYHNVVSNATWQQDVSIGSSGVVGGSVEIEQWKAIHTDSSGITRWTGSFTRTGCIPVTTTILYPDGHSLSESLMDVTIGIANTSIWDIDKELCP